jgi:hypothetical protein
MYGDEYNFDTTLPVRIYSALFFAWFGGLRVFSDDSHAQFRTPSLTRPEFTTTSRHGMLSAEDAHNRPLLDINSPPVQLSPVVMVSEPPPGFVPFNSSPA